MEPTITPHGRACAEERCDEPAEYIDVPGAGDLCRSDYISHAGRKLQRRYLVEDRPTTRYLCGPSQAAGELGEEPCGPVTALMHEVINGRDEYVCEAHFQQGLVDALLLETGWAGGKRVQPMSDYRPDGRRGVRAAVPK